MKHIVIKRVAFLVGIIRLKSDIVAKVPLSRLRCERFHPKRRIPLEAFFASRRLASHCGCLVWDVQGGLPWMAGGGGAVAASSASLRHTVRAEARGH